MAKCPQCTLQVPEVYPIDLDLREKIKKSDPEFQVDVEICKSCLKDLRRKLSSSGGALLAKERVREQRKKKLWDLRVALIKHGKALMNNKLYNEAAVSYEKYLKLLEMVFECKPGELTPESLKESAKTAELTIIVGVYWDLLRIYDSSEQLADRQRHAAGQLAKFINYTTAYADIMKKAEAFVQTARNPDVVKSFISQANKKRVRCFIATSAFEMPNAIEVQYLRAYRDYTLKKSFWGRKFVYVYYRVSPTIAKMLDNQKWLKPHVRKVLRFLINHL